MEKIEIIARIKSIIEKHGTFSIGEVDSANSVLVNEMGNLVALGEYFNSTTVEISVYNASSFSSDEIDSYELTYEELPKEVLEEILFAAEIFETDSEKTLKRISN